MRTITIFASILLIVSCAKKTEELVSPEPPVQTSQTTDSQRLGIETIDAGLEFDQADSVVTQVEVTVESEMASESVASAKVDTAGTVMKAESPVEPIEPIEPIEAEEPQVENIIVTPPVPKPEIIFADSVFEDYMIKRGDWLSKIAKQEYGDWLMWKKIYTWNKKTIGSNPNLIYPYHFLDLLKPADQAKKCPVEFYDYTIKSGETLWSIAGTVFGDELAWIILYMDNEVQLESNAGVLKPGMIIQLRKKLDPCS